MKMRLLLYLFIALCLVGCNTHKALVSSRQVETRCVKGSQEEIWKGEEALGKIYLKPLQVLIIDGTDVVETIPFQNPFYERFRTRDPFIMDSVVESVYYNKLVAKTLKKGLPGKNNVRFLAKKVSEEVLDSLMRVDKLNMIIIARQIKFDYKYEYIGLDSIARAREKTQYVEMPIFNGEHSMPNLPTMSVDETLGATFDFSTRRNPTTETRTITYYTDWELLIKFTDENKEILRQQIKQQGCVTHHIYDAEKLLQATAKEAGKTISRVFSR